jgi:hypothetical protein
MSYLLGFFCFLALCGFGGVLSILRSTSSIGGVAGFGFSSFMAGV